MSSNITLMKMTDRPVMAAVCSLDVSKVAPRGSGLSLVSSLLPALPVRERSERPTGAPVVVATQAQASAYAFAAAATGAGAASARTAEGGHGINGAIASGLVIGQQQKKTQHGMAAFRGPKPWSDPS